MYFLAHIKLNEATAFLTHRVLKSSQKFRQNLVEVLKDGPMAACFRR